MSIRFAFVGFRHNHVRDMFRRCQERDDVDVVACCEEDAATRDALAIEGEVAITHTDFQQLLDRVECDVVAIGDCYGKRGGLVARALAAKHHVISDKPLCISLEELNRIETLAEEHGRTVGCMLDMRDSAVFLGLREVLQSRMIGDVHAIGFGGQHPLLYGTRPSWYFEPGMHGGTLNDIAVHAIDMIPWATGLRIVQIVAARGWNATLPEIPHFQQCGQVMLQLENGAGVVADVSYLLPDSFGYQSTLYWQFTIWGSDGVVVAGANLPQIMVYQNGETLPIEHPLPAGKPGAYLDSFLREICGETAGLHLSSRDALNATRIALQIQRAADRGETNITV